jgi:hypothetical protein
MAVQKLTELVLDRAKKDQVYRLTCVIENLHAVQGRHDGETDVAHISIDEQKDVTHTDGIPSGEEATPVQRRRGRQQTTTKKVTTYQFQRNGSPEELLLEIGGPYGLMAKALRDATVAVNKAKYWMASMTLISFMPAATEYDAYVLARGQTTISVVPIVPMPYGTKMATAQDCRLEKRNTQRGEVMVPVLHERLMEPITLEVDMTVNAECPRTAAEIAGLLHAMQGVPFGPAKRGRLRIINVVRVQ